MTKPLNVKDHQPGDLVVVGGGLAGLVAANRAVEQGRRALVLEKGEDDEYPCTHGFRAGRFTSPRRM